MGSLTCFLYIYDFPLETLSLPCGYCGRKCSSGRNSKCETWWGYWTVWIGGVLSEGRNGKNEIRGLLGVRTTVRALDSAPNEMWNHCRAWNKRGLLSDFWFKWVTFTQMVVSRMGYIDSQYVGLLYSILILFNVAFEREGDFF